MKKCLRFLGLETPRVSGAVALTWPSGTRHCHRYVTRITAKWLRFAGLHPKGASGKNLLAGRQYYQLLNRTQSLLSAGKRLQSVCLISEVMTKSCHENLDDGNDRVT